MADLTATQIAAINTQLSVNLSTVTDDRLIELCLLYRSAPSVRPAFVAALNAEITRRFTPAYIAANDVMFSVIQNFANQFNPELQYKEKLYQFVNATNREVWMTENISFFEATLETPSRLDWLLNDSVVLNAVLVSPIAFNKVAASSTAMNAVAASSTAMTAVAASSTAMTAVIESSTAMTAVAASSTALSAIVKSAVARNALIANNNTFQSVRDTIFNTVKANWTMTRRLQYKHDALSNANGNFTSPIGFVFAYLGQHSTSYAGVMSMTHPNGVLAVNSTSRTMGDTIYTLTTPLDGISFNGLSLTKISGAEPRASLELWIPPVI